MATSRPPVDKVGVKGCRAAADGRGFRRIGDVTLPLGDWPEPWV